MSVRQYDGVVHEKRGSVSKRNPMPSLMVWIKYLIHVLCATQFCTLGLVHPVSILYTYKCFPPTTCASSHVGLKEKAVVVTARQEQAAAPVETPEPTPEGTTHVHWTHMLYTPFTVDKGTCSGVMRCCMFIDLPIIIELVDFSVNLTLGLLFEVCAVNISQWVMRSLQIYP